VEAGRGVFDGTRDFVEGLVLRRTGGAGEDATLEVGGTGVDRGGGATFHRLWTVTVAHADTEVVRRGDESDLTTDAVNVGQRIVAFGDLSRADETLDATVAGEGLVRLLETGVAGIANGPVASGVLSVDVATIARRPVARFDFDVDGVVVADPSDLAVGVGPLALPTVDAGSAVVALGFFAPVSAPSDLPDFRALAVVDRTDAASALRIGWDAGTASPFTASGDSGVTVDLSAASAATVDVGRVAPVDLLGGSDPRVVPASAGAFALVERGIGETLHRDFGEWLADLEGRLTRASGAVSAHGLAALGRWEASTRTLTARRLVVFLR
jgi:hypothetical protein